MQRKTLLLSRGEQRGTAVSPLNCVSCSIQLTCNIMAAVPRFSARNHERQTALIMSNFQILNLTTRTSLTAALSPFQLLIVCFWVLSARDEGNYPHYKAARPLTQPLPRFATLQRDASRPKAKGLCNTRHAGVKKAKEKIFQKIISPKSTRESEVATC